MKSSLFTILKVLCLILIVGCSKDDSQDPSTPDNTIYNLIVSTNFPCEISANSEFTYEVKNADGSLVSSDAIALTNGENNYTIPIKIGQTYQITAIGDFTGQVELCIEPGLDGDIKTSVSLAVNSSAAQINNTGISQNVTTNGFNYSYGGNISAN